MTASPNQTLGFIFTTFPPEVSGSALYNWQRIQWLAQQGCYRVIALVPDWGTEASLPTVPPKLQETLILEPYPSRPWPIYQLLRSPQWKAADYMRDRLAYYQPDIITVVDVERLFWFGVWHLPGVKYARTNKIPYLSEYHTDYYNHVSTYRGGRLIQKIIKPLTCLLYHSCSQTLAISDTAQLSLQQLGVNNSIMLPMYGLDLAEFSPDKRDHQYLHSWLSKTEHSHQVVLFMGRLAMEKRLDWLIQAFALVKKQYPQCSLFIAGDGPQDVVTQLKKMARSVPHIHFLGFIQGDAKAKLLASCDVYCSPAPYETFGRTPIEAMASGIPIITINRGGVTTYIRHGINGYLVAPDDIQGLSEALMKVLITPNPALIKQAQSDANQYSLEQRCQNLHKYYQQILSSNFSSTRDRETLETQEELSS